MPSPLSCLSHRSSVLCRRFSASLICLLLLPGLALIYFTSSFTPPPTPSPTPLPAIIQRDLRQGGGNLYIPSPLETIHVYSILRPLILPHSPQISIRCGSNKKFILYAFVNFEFRVGLKELPHSDHRIVSRSPRAVFYHVL